MVEEIFVEGAGRGSIECSLTLSLIGVVSLVYPRPLINPHTLIGSLDAKLRYLSHVVVVCIIGIYKKVEPHES